MTIKVLTPRNYRVSYYNAILNDGPSLYFRLGEQDYSDPAKEEVIGNDGTYTNSTGRTPISSLLNDSLDNSDGASYAMYSGGNVGVNDQSIFIPSHLNLNVTNKATFEFFISPDTSTANTRMIFRKGEFGENVSNRRPYEISWHNFSGNRNLQLLIKDSSASQTTTARIPNLTSLENTIIHCVFTYDGTKLTNEDAIKGYVNGQEQSLTFVGALPTDPLLVTSIGTLGNGAVIGANNTSGLGAQLFTGGIDELIVYKKVLTHNQIKFHYNIHTSL